MYSVEDGRATVKKKYIHSLGAVGKKVTDVALVDSYTVDKKFDTNQFDKIKDALHSPLVQIG